MSPGASSEGSRAGQRGKLDSVGAAGSEFGRLRHPPVPRPQQLWAVRSVH